MELDEAIKIVRTVAEGVNPFTGEVFGEGSVYQHPQMVRAMYRALAALESRKKWEERQQNRPENAGKPWRGEEIDQVVSEFESGVPISELARRHKRTRGAIEACLEKAGKIEPKEDRYRRG